MLLAIRYYHRHIIGHRDDMPVIDDIIRCHGHTITATYAIAQQLMLFAVTLAAVTDISTAFDVITPLLRYRYHVGRQYRRWSAVVITP